MQLAINEFSENKKNQAEEAKRNEFQFQKNIQTYQELVKTNKESNEYIVNSQKPYLKLEFNNKFQNDSLTFGIKFKNKGFRRPLVRERTAMIYDIDDKKIFDEKRQFPKEQIWDDDSFFNIVVPVSINNRKTPYRLYVIIEVQYIDELTNQNYNRSFYYYTPDLRGKVIESMFECNQEYIDALSALIKKNRLKK